MLLPILTAIKVIGGVVLAIFTGMSLPVIAIVAGIVALVAIIIRLKSKWTEMVSAFRASSGIISGKAALTALLPKIVHRDLKSANV